MNQSLEGLKKWYYFAHFPWIWLEKNPCRILGNDQLNQDTQWGLLKPKGCNCASKPINRDVTTFIQLFDIPVSISLLARNIISFLTNLSIHWKFVLFKWRFTFRLQEKSRHIKEYSCQSSFQLFFVMSGITLVSSM